MLPTHVLNLLLCLSRSVGLGIVVEKNHWNSPVSKGAVGVFQLPAINIGINGLSLLQKFQKYCSTPVAPHIYGQHARSHRRMGFDSVDDSDPRVSGTFFVF